MTERDREFWMHRRRLLIAELNALDDYLQLPRTIPSRQERRIMSDKDIEVAIQTALAKNNES